VKNINVNRKQQKSKAQSVKYKGKKSILKAYSKLIFDMSNYLKNP